MTTQVERDFPWVRFYEEFADKLLDNFMSDPDQLLTKFKAAMGRVAEEIDYQYPFTDRFLNGNEGHLEEICPFSVLGSFNLGMDFAKRRTIATELKTEFEIKEQAPAEFDGIPVIPAMRAWYFGFKHERQDDAIQVLWSAFTAAREFANSPNSTTRSVLIESFDKAINVFGTSQVNLTIGFYRMRPRVFIALDSRNERFLKDTRGDVWPKKSPRNWSGAEYLEFWDRIKELIDSGEVSSIPQLSQDAWDYSEGKADSRIDEAGRDLEKNGEFTPKDEPEARKRIETSVALRRGQPKFRRDLLETYEGRCAITECNAPEALEAAHIGLHEGADLNDVTNGLLLRADIHTLFDRHLISIDPATRRVQISKLLRKTKYGSLHGKDVRQPQHKKNKPNPKALQEHWDKAQFLRKGHW